MYSRYYKKSKCKLTTATITDVGLCRKFVLNPLCHQDSTKHESSVEIQKAIGILRKLTGKRIKIKVIQAKSSRFKIKNIGIVKLI
ncbi:hypothetical protein EZS27_027901 [termite gut metagenome]|uniref:Uncharacterized protein n=1 Tax=termite gut metagenome TaxID=433724 RepID=A0A5J4QL14_9ZZZZ